MSEGSPTRTNKSQSMWTKLDGGCDVMASTASSNFKTSKLLNLKSVLIFLHLCVFRELRQLRACFNALDADGSGAIGIEEL
jgi:hypothetical protein